MQKTVLTPEQAIKLLALPSKQLQLFLIMNTVASSDGSLSEQRIYEVANAIRLKASRVSGNLSTLQKRRLILDIGDRNWLVNPTVTSTEFEKDNPFIELEKIQALENLANIIEKHGKPD